MPDERDNRDVLKVLETEELFVRVGGYDRPPASRPGGPSVIFQDSPACPNSGSTEKHVACADCALIQFVPAEKKNEKVPCHHIPLNELGETVDTLYRWGTLEETKMILADWLKWTIGEMRFMRNRLHPRRGGRGVSYRAQDGT